MAGWAGGDLVVFGVGFLSLVTVGFGGDFFAFVRGGGGGGGDGI